MKWGNQYKMGACTHFDLPSPNFPPKKYFGGCAQKCKWVKCTQTGEWVQYRPKWGDYAMEQHCCSAQKHNNNMDMERDAGIYYCGGLSIITNLGLSISGNPFPLKLFVVAWNTQPIIARVKRPCSIVAAPNRGCKAGLVVAANKVSTTNGAISGPNHILSGYVSNCEIALIEYLPEECIVLVLAWLILLYNLLIGC